MSNRLHIFEYGGKKFVSGLFWQVLSRPRDLKKEARELAKQLNFDYVLLRTGYLPQAGFGAKEDGCISGLASLAAIVSKAMDMANHGDSWMAAFELPDGKFAYVAVRDGGFLANGDFAGTRDEVLERMTEDYSVGRWDKIIAPQDFNFPDSIEKPFDSFLPTRNGKVMFLRWWKLDPIKAEIPVKKILAAAIAVVLVVGVVGGWLYYKKAQEELENQRALAEMQARLAEQMRQAEVIQIPPWAQLPLTSEFVQTCEASISDLPRYAAGWSLGSAGCSLEGMEGIYERGPGGTVKAIHEALPIGIKTDLRGESGIVMEHFQFDLSRNDDVLPLAESMARLQTNLQSLGLAFQVADQENKGNVPGVTTAATEHYRIHKFSLTSVLSPSEIVEAFDVPGVRLNKLVYKQSEWAIEGVLYAK